MSQIHRLNAAIRASVALTVGAQRNGPSLHELPNHRDRQSHPHNNIISTSPKTGVSATASSTVGLAAACAIVDVTVILHLNLKTSAVIKIIK